MDDIVSSQMQRLDACRKTLRICLHQVSLFTDAYVPIPIIHQIAFCSHEIQQLKLSLRSQGISIPDDPDDKTSAQLLSHIGYAPSAVPTVLPSPILDNEALSHLWKKATDAYAKNNWEDAVVLFEEIAATNPRYEQVSRLLVRTKKQLQLLAEYRRLCGFENSQWQAAKRAFERIRSDNPQFPDPQGLGRWIEEHETWSTCLPSIRQYLKQNKRDKAIEQLLEFVDEYPQHEQAHHMLEELLAEQAHEKHQLQQAMDVQQRFTQLQALRLQQQQANEEAVMRERMRRQGVLVLGTIIFFILVFTWATLIK